MAQDLPQKWSKCMAQALGWKQASQKEEPT